MNRPLTLLGIVGVLASCLPGVLLIAAHSQASKPPAELTESEARKMLSDSPWAKRSKLRSMTKAATYNQPFENPGTTPGGLGRAGLGAP
jgi:hypothetical protein